MVVKLVEASNFQHLPKIHISPYVPVHFSHSRRICTPISNMERAGLVGCVRKIFVIFKSWLNLARVVPGYPMPDPRLLFRDIYRLDTYSSR